MLERAQVPTDLVGTLVFLASDESDFITGGTTAVALGVPVSEFGTLCHGGETQGRGHSPPEGIQVAYHDPLFAESTD